MTDQERGLHKEHIWLVALYEQEERAEELLGRLNAIGVDTSEATTLRVEIDEQQRAAKFAPMTGASPLSLTVRSAITGALAGGALAMLISLAFYSTGTLSLPFLTGLFNHAVASVAAGALIGAFLGSIFGSAKQRKTTRAPITKMSQLKSDGFLVAVKMAPRLAEQAEEIARGLGAKEILL
ncbi:MAG: hypothetical protein AB7U82_10300 [Blastocatellales bacterium]